MEQKDRLIEERRQLESQLSQGDYKVIKCAEERNLRLHYADINKLEIVAEHFTGSDIIYEGNELLYRTLPRELCHDIALLCRKCNMYALFEHKDHTCYDAELPGNNDNPLVEYFRRSGRKLITDIEDTVPSKLQQS